MQFRNYFVFLHKLKPNNMLNTNEALNILDQAIDRGIQKGNFQSQEVRAIHKALDTLIEALSPPQVVEEY